jgi:Cu-Zn family superoxide dismutase
VLTDYLLPGDGVFPEGITEDPDGVRFYVSSYAQGTIFRGRLDEPEAEVWLAPGADGRTKAAGMAVDPAGRLLVCGGDTGQLFGYDTASGTLVARHTVPGRSLLNDVCVAGGYAYVTDSVRPVLWRVPLGDAIGAPEEWLTVPDPGELPYLNGIVALDAGRTLLVAAQGTGTLWRIDVAAAVAEQVDVAAAAAERIDVVAATAEQVDVGGVPVNGDGLVVVDDLVYVCDNIDRPDGGADHVLTALRPAPDRRSAALVGRWPQRHRDTPTTIAHLGNRLLLVHSQFAGQHDGTAAAPFVVRAIPVPTVA